MFTCTQDEFVRAVIFLHDRQHAITQAIDLIINKFISDLKNLEKIESID